MLADRLTGRTPLLTSAESGHADVVATLLEAIEPESVAAAIEGRGGHNCVAEMLAAAGGVVPREVGADALLMAEQHNLRALSDAGLRVGAGKSDGGGRHGAGAAGAGTCGTAPAGQRSGRHEASWHAREVATGLRQDSESREVTRATFACLVTLCVVWLLKL